MVFSSQLCNAKKIKAIKYMTEKNLKLYITKGGTWIIFKYPRREEKQNKKIYL